MSDLTIFQVTNADGLITTQYNRLIDKEVFQADAAATLIREGGLAANTSNNNTVSYSGEYTMTTGVVDSLSFPGSSIYDKIGIERYFGEKVKEYLQTTVDMVNMNDMINMNTYMTDSIVSQLKKAENVYKKTTSDLNKMRKQFYNTNYERQYYKFYTSLFIVSLLFYTSCVLIVAANRLQKFPDVAMFALVGIFTLLWIVYIIVMLNNKRKRGKEEWDKLNFTLRTDVNTLQTT